MKKYLNRVAVNTATEGTGTLSLGSAISDAFLTPTQAGGEDEDLVSYVIQEGTNFEIGEGTLNITGGSLTRDEIYISKINGTASQTKMDLGGQAVVRFIAAAEDYIRTPDSVTPLSPVWFNTDDGNELGMGDVITPSEITVDQHDYEPTGLSTAVTLRLSSDAERTITGLAGGASQREMTLANVGSNDIVLADSSGSSSAANRFALGAALTLRPGAAVRLVYDGTSNRWRARHVLLDTDDITNASDIDGTLLTGALNNVAIVPIDTITADDDTELDFLNIPYYPMYQLVLNGFEPVAAGNPLLLRIGSGSFETGNDYQQQVFRLLIEVDEQNSFSDDTIDVWNVTPPVNNAGSGAMVRLDIFNAIGGGSRIRAVSQGVYRRFSDGNASTEGLVGAYEFANFLSPIDRLRFFFEGTNISTGRATLIGLRDV